MTKKPIEFMKNKVFEALKSGKILSKSKIAHLSGVHIYTTDDMLKLLLNESKVQKVKINNREFWQIVKIAE